MVGISRVEVTVTYISLCKYCEIKSIRTCRASQKPAINLVSPLLCLQQAGGRTVRF